MPAVVVPIFAVVGSLFAGAAAAVGAVAAGVGAVAGAIGIGTGSLLAGVATAALVGAEYLLRPSVGGQPQLPAPQNGPAPVPARRTLRQADAPRCFIFGRTRLSGSYIGYESDGYFGDSSPFARQLYQAIYLCDGPIDGWDAFICDDEAAPIIRTSNDPNITDGTQNANIYAFSSGSKKTSSTSNSVLGYYVVAFEPANATEAGYSSILWTDYSTRFGLGSRMAGVWPATSLGKGITAVYTWACMQRISQNARPTVFPTGFPEWSFCVRGARVYDPRDPSQTILRNGAWALYNATWKWSENPALVAAHFVMWLISQNLTAIVDVDWASIAAAANDCDRLVSATMRNINNGAKGGATEPFARLTGTYYFTIPPREFLSQIMAACDGSYSIDKDGRFTMWIGKWEDPAVTFTESDVGGFTEEFVAPVTEAVNEIHSTYVEPANAYQRYEAPVWRDEASVSKIGRRLVSIKYDLVPSANQAYRLSQRYARRINGKRKLQITLGPRGMLAFKQRVVGLTLPNFGIPQSTWRVEALQPDGNLTRWTATLRELTPDVFNDDPPDTDPAASLKIVSAFTTSAPSNFLVAKYASGAGASTSYVVVSMNQHLNAPDNSAAGIVTSDVIQEQTLGFEVAYSTDGGFTYVQATTYLSNYIVRTPDLPNGTTVFLMCRYMNADGSYSAFSSAQAITL